VSGDDWLLFLHVLSAFALVGALTGYTALAAAMRPPSPALDAGAARRIALPLTVAIGVGTLGTVVFGVWLALTLDQYSITDAWIIAALVLWAVGSDLAQRSGKVFASGATSSPVGWRRGVVLHTGSCAAAIAILVLMFWKPGA